MENIVSKHLSARKHQLNRSILSNLISSVTHHITNRSKTKLSNEVKQLKNYYQRKQRVKYNSVMNSENSHFCWSEFSFTYLTFRFTFVLNCLRCEYIVDLCSRIW